MSYYEILQIRKKLDIPIDTGRKLNAHKTFRRRPGRLLNVLCTFNLRPVSTGYGSSFSLSFYSHFRTFFCCNQVKTKKYMNCRF